MKNLQNEVNDTIADGARLDADMAAVFNVADGRLPDTPQGDPANTNLADRRANQVAAFRQVYRRDPTSENDWRMAGLLDPHTYDPKYRGTKSEIRVATINSIKGKGIVRGNWFIPDQRAGNIIHNELGDNRGYDSNATPDHSRASAAIDFDNGIIVFRQNPSVPDDGTVKIGSPSVYAAQDSDGKVLIKYDAANPLTPGGSGMSRALLHTVSGEFVAQVDQGPPRLGGIIDRFSTNRDIP